MGAFNTVNCRLVCPSCKEAAEVTVQFKYGNTAQLNYGVGDRLRWGGNDIGEPGRKHVVIDSIVSSQCPRCGFTDDWYVYVHIENDRISMIESEDGRYNFLDSDGYLILE